jgi:uncharacterized sulfatase
MRAWLLVLAALSASAAEPNNILFILTDDQAPWALGLSGNAYADTPNLDQLFRRGAYLTNSFTVTPVCSPSRASLATSRYGSELGVTDWLHPGREPNQGLDPRTTTWAEQLRKAGYKTALIGKWHLGLPDAFHPTLNGYDTFMGFRGGGTTPADPTLEKYGVERKFEGLTTDILTDQAIAFLKTAHVKPFALSLHYRAPHARWLPVAEEDWAPFANLDPTPPHPDFPNLDTERVKRMTREYLASVHGVDRNVGRLLAVLDEQGLAENTVIVYSSDHGYNMGHNGIWHKGNGHYVLTKNPPATANIPDGQRPNLWDNSIRVPTAVVWPGVVEPGSTIAETVSNLDWYPTLIEIAGGEAPVGEAIRGRSLVPLLRGKAPDWDNEFYAEYSTHHQTRTDMRMWRTPQWKLIRDFLNPERDELYNLRHDPGETTNLIADAAHAEIVKDLHAKIIARMREVGDPLAKVVR